MKKAAYVLAGIFGLLGLIFLVGSGQGNTLPRVIIGIVLLGATAFMVYFARSKGPEMKVTHKVDFTGDTELQHLQCKSCGAQLSADAVEMKEGAIYVKCPYCGTAYQLEEKPKW
jgi:DNA-directed RNA polymerase subunit RPC12/RpoP